MAPRLKVFVTSDGLTDYVVAASSRPKALAAWGVRQDVFKEGQAHETDDPALVKAALAHPGEVLRTSAGARGKLAALKPAASAKTARPAGPSRAQLRKVADLEARIVELEAAHDRALAENDAARAALDRRRQALEDRHSGQRKKLQTALQAAREALG